MQERSIEERDLALASALIGLGMEYNQTGIKESLERNPNLHHFRGKFDDAFAAAVISDFINFMMYRKGIRISIHADDLGKKVEISQYVH
jgi:hypothetical protein